MMKVIAFGASNSSKSINKRFAAYGASLIKDAQVEVLDLNDYDLPIFSPDQEEGLGQPQQAHDFRKKLAGADIIVLSLAEHNSCYTAAFKNLFDWCSRIDREIFAGKPTVLLATSPGGRGAITILEFAQNHLPRFGADIKGVFSYRVFMIILI